MSRELPEVISDIFTYHGALVERTGDDSLEFIAAPDLAGQAGVPEHGRLTFNYEASKEGLIYASFDSELFSSLANIVALPGRFAFARYSSAISGTEKLAKTVMEKNFFSNATFRYETIERKVIGYLFLLFKYTAVSDDKREGIFSLLVNELNGSVTPLDLPPEALFAQLKEDRDGYYGEKESINKDILHAGWVAGSHIAVGGLTDFVRSLERRLNRDVRRVYEYYETLKNEIERAVAKKQPGDMTTEKLLAKTEAIDMEKQWKVRDLISKYSLSVALEPVIAVRIRTEAPLFWINIKRRLLSRQFPITYNPILKRFDDLSCESCHTSGSTHSVCDEKLHIVCPNCFVACPVCGKQYCAACHTKGCPKCTRG